MRVAGEWRGLPRPISIEHDQLTDEYSALEWWADCRPWPLHQDIACQQQFGLSLGSDVAEYYPELKNFINSDIEYLILPVYNEQQQCVWFVARAMGEAPRPYLNPPGPRHHWRSWALGPRKYGKIVLCEGIGDAACISQWADSVGLCGRHYNGSLNNTLAGQDVVIALDGDLPGFAGSVEIAEQVSQVARSIKIFSRDGKDPTDYTEADVQEMLS